MNGSPSLDGPRAKLTYAKRHQDTLVSAINDWLGSNPYLIEPHFDSATGWIEMRLREVHPPPIEFGLIFGDMINNLRGALDHLVWQLVLANQKTPTDGTGFPIVKREENWERAAASRLARVDERWIREIRSLQPFHDGPDAPKHPLAVLDHANNINKHRVISPYGTKPMHYSPTLSFNRPTRGDERIIVQPMEADTELRDGAILGRVKVVSSGDDLIPHVQPVAPNAITVGFDIGGEIGIQNSVVFTEVERIISLFEPAFGR